MYLTVNLVAGSERYLMHAVALKGLYCKGQTKGTKVLL